MTAPMVQETEQERIARVRRELATLKANGAPPEVVEYYLSKEKQSVNETTKAEEPDESPWTLANAGRSLRATAANVAQGIPGMEAVQAGARALVRGQSYPDALSDIRGEVSKLPVGNRIVNEAAGGGLAGSVLGKLVKGLPAASAAAKALRTPARQAAAYGAATQLLDADPDKGLAERGARAAVVGSAAGAATKGFELIGNEVNKIGTALKSRNAPTPASLLHGQKEALKDATGPLYDKALREGVGRATSKELRSLLDREDIAAITSRLRELDEFQGMADDSPEMLDALFKALSDRELALKKGSDLIVGGKAVTNLGRADVKQVRTLKEDLLAALETPGKRTVPAQTTEVTLSTADTPKPTLREALNRFNERKTAAFLRNPGNETTEQRAARELLERAEAYGVATPSLSGRPSSRVVEVAPEVTVTDAPKMPTYRTAVRTTAEGKAAQQATRRGADAVAAVERTRTPGSALDKRSPEAYEAWLKTATPAEKKAFEAAVLGETGVRVRGSLEPKSFMDVTLLPMLMKARSAGGAGSQMLRAARGLPEGIELPPGIAQSVLAALLEGVGR